MTNQENPSAQSPDDSSTDTVTLIDNRTGRRTTLPILDGTAGPSVIDVRNLYAKAGYFTFDPGFTATGSCESRVTFIDGDRGILLHRGYAIEDLVEHCDYLEVCYLLLDGQLPMAPEKEDFNRTITYHNMVHEQLAAFYRGFRRDAHPMAVLCGVTGAMSAFYHDSTDIENPEHRMIAGHRLVAKMPNSGRDGLQVFARSAVHLSPQRTGLCRKLSEHALRGALRAVQDQSGPGPGDGSHTHSPCRP